MSLTLTIPSGQSSGLSFSACGAFSESVLKEMADALTLPEPCEMENPPDALQLVDPGYDRDGERITRFRLSNIHYTGGPLDGVLCVEAPERFRNRSRRFAVIRMLLSIGYLRRILKSDGKTGLLHGALPETENGECVLLFGQSGIGKSTSMKRWESEGGICEADDLLLLEESEGDFFCRPLPTWSRFFSDPECRDTFPVMKRLHLKDALWLTRAKQGTPERIEQVHPGLWRAQVLSAATIHLYDSMRILSESEKIYAGRKYMSLVQDITQKFGTRTLRASLDANLHETINNGIKEAEQ